MIIPEIDGSLLRVVSCSWSWLWDLKLPSGSRYSILVSCLTKVFDWNLTASKDLFWFSFMEMISNCFSAMLSFIITALCHLKDVYNSSRCFTFLIKNRWTAFTVDCLPSSFLCRISLATLLCLEEHFPMYIISSTEEDSSSRNCF